MHPLHPAFGLIVYLIAIATAFLLNKRFRLAFAKGRNETIDGLRGLLAIGVFIHHAAIWHAFLLTGKWVPPASNLYTHLGHTSVSFFFMITSFLFVSKLLNSSEQGYDFEKFFRGRLFRLVPMYMVTIVPVFVFLFAASDWKLNVSGEKFLQSIFHWFTFTIISKPQINGSVFTSPAMGVVWSLPYEWLFYFCLPLLGFFIQRKKPDAELLLISIVFAIGFYFAHGIVWYHILSFAGGAVAPFLKRYTSLTEKVNHVAVGIIIIACLLLIGIFPNPLNVSCQLLIAIVFTAVALGNSFFGLLRSSALKFLGEVCYSTYLLHSLLLFVVYYFLFGLDTVKGFTGSQYCLLVFCITPVLVFISYAGFRYVEKPFMNRSRVGV